MLEPTRPSAPRFSGEQLMRANLGDWLPDVAQFTVGRRHQRPLCLLILQNTACEAPLDCVVAAGGIVTDAEAKGMLADDSADYAKVFRRYVTSDDIANRVEQSPGRCIIDFAQIGLAGTTKFARALAIARDCSRSSQAIA